MAELDITVAGVAAEPFAATPTLVVHLRVADAGRPVHALALRTQVRIEPQRRSYSPAEADRLVELFGRPAQWEETLRPFLWAQLGTVTGSFEGAGEVEVQLPCTYDFEVSAARYLHGLDEGDIPLLLLFSGTIFRSGPGGLSVEPIAWHTECRHRLPVTVWRDLMNRYFPGGGWLRLRSESIDALGRFKAEAALPSFDEAIELLVKRAGGSS
jgi:Family of unknown function (DUF6084)